MPNKKEEKEVIEKEKVIDKKVDKKVDKKEKIKKEATKEKSTNKNKTNKRIEEVVDKLEKEKSKVKKENTKKEPKTTSNAKQTKRQTTKNTQTEEKEEKKKTKKKVKKELVVKENPEELDEKKLEKIEEEIKKQTTIPEEKKLKINKRIFQNIIIAIAIVLYFTFINLGFYNIEPSKFLIDLQVFSMLTIGITIIVFEKAYKKDSGELAIYGIESLVLSICTLLTIYVGMYYNNKFSYIINTISMLFAIYYVGKSIVIYTKMKRKALKRASDIDKIRRAK